MKKAKIMLTAIALFAIIGGLLAYKAQGLGNVYVNRTLPNGQVRCDLLILTLKTTATNQPGFFVVGTTINTTDACVEAIKVTTTIQ